MTTFAATLAATSAASMVVSLTISASTVAMYRLEAVALGLRSSGSDLGGRLRVVVSPGLGGGRGSRGSSQAGLGLGRVPGDVNPLLRLGEVVGVGVLGIPLVLSGGVGGAVGNISGVVELRGLVLRVAVHEGLGRTLVDLRKTGVGDGGVGARCILGLLLGLLGRL